MRPTWFVLACAILPALTLANCSDSEPKSDPPPEPACGDARLDPGETCEGMPLPEGCDPVTCTVQDGYQCSPPPPEPASGDGTGGDSGGTVDPPMWMSSCVLLPVCGNEVIEDGEQCDDGDANAGDGCSDTCQIETEDGWTCDGAEPTECWRCGDGFLDPGEECDTGFLLGNDIEGCTDACTIVPGWECFLVTGQYLCGPLCGDGMFFDISIPGVTKGFAEECDDGNLMPGDGCDAQCEVEDDCICESTAPATSVCQCGVGGSSSGTDSGGSGSGGSDSGGSGSGGSGSDSGGSGTAATTGM